MLATDFPDPNVLATPAGYLAFGTTAHGTHVQVARSSDLLSWQPLPDALPSLPAWVQARESDVWAPAAAKFGDHWLLYFSARDRASAHQCIGVATSRVAAGPYTAAGDSPLLCQLDLGGSIDPFVYAEATHRYLLWKNDGNCCARSSTVWMQELSVDGLGLRGRPVALLGRDQPWESGATSRETTIERPSMLRVNGTRYLFYSGNGYDTSRYSMGYAVCAALLTPCHKPRTAPLLSPTDAVAGPGGGTVIESRDRGYWLVYAAWSAAAVGYENGGVRSLRVDPVVFVGGLPVVEGPTSVPVALPPRR